MTKLSNNSGLSAHDIERIQTVLRAAGVARAIIFGSRAMGNYKHGSDVDIALLGESITADIVSRVSSALNEHTTMPYRFDIVHYDTLQNPALKKHIDEYGVILL